MNVPTITLPKDEALAAYRQYRSAVRQTAEDKAIMMGYRALAKGKTIIDLHEALKSGGVDELGRPRLAVARADWHWCHINRWGGDEILNFMREPNGDWRSRFSVPSNLFPALPAGTNNRRARALVPLIPAHVRPAKLSDYHILWEADWKAVPTDPMLLKKLSGNLFLVLACWDLSPLERAVLKGRLLAN